MSKFKLGERVIFYSHGRRMIGEINVLTREENVYGVLCPKFDYSQYDCHEKQLRKIKKKPKFKGGDIVVCTKGGNFFIGVIDGIDPSLEFSFGVRYGYGNNMVVFCSEEQIKKLDIKVID